MKFMQSIKRKSLLLKSFFSRSTKTENSTDFEAKKEQKHHGMEDYAQWAGIETTDQYKMLYKNVQSALREKKMSLK